MAAPVITRCRSENLPILAFLDRVCFSDPLPADDLCEYLTNSEKDASRLFDADDQGFAKREVALLLSSFDSSGHIQPVGFILLVLRDELGVIERLGICPRHRKMGYARLLLDRVLAESRHLRVTIWGVELDESDLSSQQFFSRVGFLNSCPPVTGGLDQPGSSTIVLWRQAD